VPYRDSKLTRLLQNSLGGNSYTTLVATIHPVVPYADECLSTLQFANRCRNVRNQPRVNYQDDPNDKAALIRRLQEEIKALRAKLAQYEMQGGALNPDGTRNPLGGPMGLGGGGIDFDALMKAGNTRALQVLKALGIDATIQPDGSIVTSDGRVIGAPSDMERQAMASLLGKAMNPSASVIDNLGLSMVTSGSTLQALAGQAMAALMNAPQALKEYVYLLEKEKEDFKRKANKKTVEIDELNQQISQNLSVYNEAASESRNVHEELLLKVQAKERQLREVEKRLQENFRSDIKSLLDNNKSILNTQHQILQQVPFQLKMNGRKAMEAKQVEERVRREEAQKADKTRRFLEMSREEELLNMKRQYEYWLAEKDAQMHSFVGAFNRYRMVRREQREKYEHELLTLHDALLATQQTLRVCESGTLSTRVKGGVSRPVVPASLRPPDPIGGKYLKETTRLLSKRQADRKQRQRIRSRAESAMSDALEGEPLEDDPLEGLPRFDFTQNEVDDDRVSPPGAKVLQGDAGAALRMINSQPVQGTYSGGSSRRVNPTVRLVLGEVLKSDVPLDELSIQEARESIGLLRQINDKHIEYKQAPPEWRSEGVDEELSDALQAILKSESVYSYVEEVQGECDYLREELKEAAQRYQDLRVAHTFLGRSPNSTATNSPSPYHRAFV